VKVTVNGAPVPETTGNALVRLESPGAHAACDAEAARLRALLATERKRAARAKAEARRLRVLLAKHVRASGDGKLLTPAEACAVLRVHPRTVTRWANAGKLAHVRTAGGHRRFREEEVLALLLGREGGAP